jgi:DNA-directed RNA polymerase sigma subunit (sigma70/sigma32)
LKIDFFNLGLTVADVAQIIDQKVFSERDRQILKRKFLDDVTYEKLAEEYDLSTQHVREIVTKHKIRLFPS